MSKNTGTSELINYFDLGVNGDVGIAGSLDINTIANDTTDKFLVRLLKASQFAITDKQ